MFSNQQRQLCTSFLKMSEDFSEYTQKLLSGLGKSTNRGVRKCINCGIYNGIRSTLCKNKACNTVLTSEDKSIANLEAVKLSTNTEKQIYSVKIWGMGPDYRGFVQLPILQSCKDEDSSIYSDVALCFVDSCQNSFDNSILKCHEETISANSSKLFCNHIKSALKSHTNAIPIELKSAILDNLNITEDIKERLRILNSEKEGTFVQKVSKSVMAVKCQASAKHPLGYLHFTFIKGKSKDGYEKFYCSCSEFPVSEISNDDFNKVKQKCLHYFACVWALASEGKHSEECLSFLKCEPSIKDTVDIITNKTLYSTTEPTVVTSKYPANLTNLKTKSEILKKVNKKTKLHRKKETIKRCHRIMPKILPIEIKVLEETPNSNDIVSWGFIDWLSFVTESINRTMQFENYGMVNTIVLQIPEDFYTCFAKRIPSVYHVLQNGNSFIYYIMNILHLKEIFDTARIKLKISKKFVHNDHKGYIEFDENDDNNDESFLCPFIYFLNVGQSTVDESDNTNNSFYIEWTPSLFSISNVGQLRFQYKYGRKST